MMGSSASSSGVYFFGGGMPGNENPFEGVFEGVLLPLRALLGFSKTSSSSMSSSSSSSSMDASSSSSSSSSESAFFAFLPLPRPAPARAAPPVRPPPSADRVRRLCALVRSEGHDRAPPALSAVAPLADSGTMGAT
eukprot:1179795-Prorocentrum_minimum.AAC.2